MCTHDNRLVVCKELEVDDISSNEGNARLLDTIDETAELLAVSRSKVYQLLRRKELEGVNIGRSHRVVTDSTRKYVERLRAAARTT
jgi:excisionase family DNA binding protein